MYLPYLKYQVYWSNPAGMPSQIPLAFGPRKKLIAEFGIMLGFSKSREFCALRMVSARVFGRKIYAYMPLTPACESHIERSSHVTAYWVIRLRMHRRCSNVCEYIQDFRTYFDSKTSICVC